MPRHNSGTGAWTTRRFLALLGSVAIWVIAAIDLWFIWPAILGGATSFVVVSGSSMEPTYYSGDLVIARKIEPSVGDVIVYAPESLGGAQIVHRIIGGNADDGWVLQGDNNDFIDPFEPKGDEVRGVVLVHYSDIGRITALLLNPIFWAALILAGVVLLVWFSGDDCDDDEEDEEDDDDAANSELLEPVADDGESGGTLSRAGPVVRTTAFIVAAVWAFSAGFSPAAASTLAVMTSNEVKAFTLNACGDPTPAWGSATSSTGTTSTQLTVSNIPAGCLNKPFTLTLRDSSGTVLATMTGTPTTSTYAFTTFAPGPSNYTVAQVASVIVNVEGWVFPTTWTAPTPPSSPAISCVAINPSGNPTGATCTVTVTNVTFWNSGNPAYHNLQIDYFVTTNQNRWEVTINYNDPSWTGGAFTPTYVGSAYNVIKAPGYVCSSLPVFKAWKAAGNVGWENNAVIFASNQPGVTNGTTQLCP